jgi:hypothetical protein
VCVYSGATIANRLNRSAELKGERPVEEVLAEMKKHDRKHLNRNEEFRNVVSGGERRPVLVKETKRTPRAYKPHSHAGVCMSVFQEFLLVMGWIRRGTCKLELALKWLGSMDDDATETVRCIIRTWVCALYEIVSKEKWWLLPKDNHRASSSAFADQEDELSIADCTDVKYNNSNISELIGQQLYSPYYKSTCGKYAVACSRIGGATFVSPGMGGPASDHDCMMLGGLFENWRWATAPGAPRCACLYDAGVSQKIKTVARAANCHMKTSGIVRNSKQSPLSAVQRSGNFGCSSRRMRVENFIGIVKQRFKVLGHKFSVSDLPLMDKVVYLCFMLHNFGSVIIK